MVNFLRKTYELEIRIKMIDYNILLMYRKTDELMIDYN